MIAAVVFDITEIIRLAVAGWSGKGGGGGGTFIVGGKGIEWMGGGPYVVGRGVDSWVLLVLGGGVGSRGVFDVDIELIAEGLLSKITEFLVALA